MGSPRPSRGDRGRGGWGRRPSPRGGGGWRDGVAVLGGAVVVGAGTVAGGWRCCGRVGGTVTEGWSRMGARSLPLELFSQFKFLFVT